MRWLALWLPQAFEAWSCYTFAESAWLSQDVDVQCGTDEHRRVKAVAIVAIVIYPAGLLILNTALLYSARHAILKRRPTALSQSIAFLHREYEVAQFSPTDWLTLHAAPPCYPLPLAYHVLSVPHHQMWARTRIATAAPVLVGIG